MKPRVECLDFVEGARRAGGLAVVIDVFRAFSLACYAAHGHVRRIYPVAGVETAIQLRQQHPDWLIAGERHARKLGGFDYGNSPTEIAAADLAGRTLVHTTHAGTQGLCACTHADEVITGSLTNAAAICRYIDSRNPALVSLVRMGKEARERCEEDDLCAELIAARLEGRFFDTAGIRSLLRNVPAAEKFFDPLATWAPERDFELCTRVDCFNFVMRLADRDGPLPWLERIAA